MSLASPLKVSLTLQGGESSGRAQIRVESESKFLVPQSLYFQSVEVNGVGLSPTTGAFSGMYPPFSVGLQTCHSSPDLKKFGEEGVFPTCKAGSHICLVSFGGSVLVYTLDLLL